MRELDEWRLLIRRDLLIDKFVKSASNLRSNTAFRLAIRISNITNIIKNMENYKGQIKDFPTEIVEKMLDYQVKQGNKRDITVFEEDKIASICDKGFTWALTEEGSGFWGSIIRERNFNLFFEKYPKTQ